MLFFSSFFYVTPVFTKSGLLETFLHQEIVQFILIGQYRLQKLEFVLLFLLSLYAVVRVGLHTLQVAESKLAKFVEDIIVPPRMIDIIVDGEVH